MGLCIISPHMDYSTYNRQRLFTQLSRLVVLYTVQCQGYVDTGASLGHFLLAPTESLDDLLVELQAFVRTQQQRILQNRVMTVISTRDPV